MGIFDVKPKQGPEEQEGLTVDERIVQALRQVYDPEIPVNIYDLGLIYRVDWDETAKKASIDMTLTSPHCPAAQELPVMAKEAAESVGEVAEAEVEIVWDPPWGPEQMSEEAKLELGFM